MKKEPNGNNTVGLHDTLADLNKREPKSEIIRRLMIEAQMGGAVDVSVADVLEFRRDQYGLTKSEFAAILGLKKSRYNKVVNGKSKLPMSAAKRAFAIGVPADVLLKLDA